jgi:hypothetical protein
MQRDSEQRTDGLWTRLVKLFNLFKRDEVASETAVTPLVWYAAYGSNVCQDLFLCYIRGGTPAGSKRNYVGCSDNSLPRDARPITIPHRLSLRWQRTRLEQQRNGVHSVGKRRANSWADVLDNLLSI